MPNHICRTLALFKILHWERVVCAVTRQRDLDVSGVDYVGDFGSRVRRR